MYNMLFVDTYEDITIVHKFNVITGDYLNAFHLKGDFVGQAMELIIAIKKDKPDKIIFDKKYIGITFYEVFMEMVREHDWSFEVDAFGLIIYKDDVD